jgi:WD40 repeat protein
MVSFVNTSALLASHQVATPAIATPVPEVTRFLPIDRLFEPLKTQIFSFLDVRDLANCGALCSNLRRAALTKRFWLAFVERDFPAWRHSIYQKHTAKEIYLERRRIELNKINKKLKDIFPHTQFHLDEPVCLLKIVDHQLFVAHQNGTVNVFDRRTWLTDFWKHYIYKTDFNLKGHQDAICSLEVNAEFILTGSKDSTAGVWNRNNGKLRFVLKGHDGPVSHVAMNSNVFVTASRGNYKIWNRNGLCIVDKTPRLRQTIGLWNFNPNALRQKGNITCLQMNKDKLIMGFNHGHLVISDLTSREPKLYRVHKGPINCLTVKDHLVIAGSDDTTCSILDLKTGMVDRLEGSENHSISHIALQFPYLVTGSKIGEVVRWNLMTKEKEILSNVHSPIKDLKINPEQIGVLTVEGHMGFWKLADSKCFYHSHTGHTGANIGHTVTLNPTYSLCFEMDNDQIISSFGWNNFAVQDFGAYVEEETILQAIGKAAYAFFEGFGSGLAG